jgi:hypothetical protein
MKSLEAVSAFLTKNNIKHIVVAGRNPAPVFGREQYEALKIKPNSKNQAAPVWHAFLRRFEILVVPKELQGIDAGAFKYKYHSRDNTICIWTQERPDQNPINPGNAGKTVVRVDDHSDFKFGALRSALVKISNVRPQYKRMTKQELSEMVQQLARQGTQSQKEVENLHEELLDHDSTLSLISDDYSDFEDLGKKYKEARKSK